ncbi:tRNA 5-methylaminomethyl-2-thiouridine biosynthesis bifunctional protein MnmC [Curvibacter sp. AEP1-3]|uniref:NAD(P)/FAD-dependent oxidoreductase n=1 Tax=Curvibacter sp. AEP1-3 TaxID=1844971 RepID=UPI000B566BEC|nr:FAD-dependent oxidoreductase [Curvibacter sp. AEP1-3]ARV17870.1 tRNA 5-methylaminomethyl-2-thiouridine biosynthesis bifunctional protein MnmC [Curvibacter sp. AEP1-3]
MTTSRHIAIVGAGMAAITCARTLVQAGHTVTVFEKSRGPGGRMSTRESAFGTFDHGAQYFTVRDARFTQALQTTPGLCRPWSANTVRVLDSHGRVAAAALPGRDAHWVPAPGMNALLRAWAKPLLDAGQLLVNTRVTALEQDSLHKKKWQLRTSGDAGTNHVYGGFDEVILAIPHPQAQELLATTPKGAAMAKKTSKVSVAPCWTLMLAYPQAVQPGLTTLGPQWNAARSTHHRVAWLSRESSKPGRGKVERWTVQASAAWSQEHLNDTPDRIQAKLIKAFAEITGIRAEPAHAQVHRWLYAKTEAPLGESFLWDSKSGIGVCGDWCIGHRVEDAFVSGLELALKVA